MKDTDKLRSVTIVVPVYGDWDSLSDCIDSLMSFVDFNKHRVLLVNDVGPEVDVIEENIKIAIDGFRGFEYYRNKKNLGFVKNCNRAVLELDKTNNDVLLLNSDTAVTEGFLEPMLVTLYGEEDIGIVSPRTNNATLATFPLFASSKKGLEPQKAYKLFIKHSAKLPAYYEAPTGHGFCMLIRRELIRQYDLFDEAFGKGYGEEVDFSQRVATDGWRSVISNRAFVFHLEARSFSLEAKQKLIAASKKIINKRYPQYRSEVREYFRDNMLIEERVELADITPKTLKQRIAKIPFLRTIWPKIKK